MIRVRPTRQVELHAGMSAVRSGSSRPHCFTAPSFIEQVGALHLLFALLLDDHCRCAST